MLYTDTKTVSDDTILTLEDMNKTILCIGDVTYKLYLPNYINSPIYSESDGMVPMGTILNIIVLNKKLTVEIKSTYIDHVFDKIGKFNDVFSYIILYTKNGWIPIADVVSPVGEIGYVYGGSGNNGDTVKNCDEFNPNSDLWSSKTDMPSPERYGLAASTINYKGYVYGGYYYYYDGSGHQIYLRDCDEYNSDLDSWLSKADIPAPTREYLAATTIEDNGYEFSIVYGGDNDSNQPIQDCDGYDPDYDEWHSLTNIPSPARTMLTASFILGKGYIYGGTDDSYNDLRDCDSFYQNTWTSKTDLPVPERSQFAATTILNKTYLFAGYGGGTIIDDCDEYDPDTWTSKTNMPFFTTFLSASTMNNKGYVYGGDSSHTDECSEYDSVGDSWVSKANMLTDRSNAAASSI